MSYVPENDMVVIGPRGLQLIREGNELAVDVIARHEDFHRLYFTLNPQERLCIGELFDNELQNNSKFQESFNEFVQTYYDDTTNQVLDRALSIENKSNEELKKMKFLIEGKEIYLPKGYIITEFLSHALMCPTKEILNQYIKSREGIDLKSVIKAFNTLQLGSKDFIEQLNLLGFSPDRKTPNWKKNL
jgi:hypothetical protein